MIVDPSLDTQFSMLIHPLIHMTRGIKFAVAYSKHIETWLGSFCLVSRLGFLSLFTLALIASMAYLSVQHLR